MIRLVGTDNDCVHYADGSDRHVCFKKQGNRSFSYWLCTSSGEPVSELSNEQPELDQLPAGNDPTSISFRAWYSAHQWLEE